LHPARSRQPATPEPSGPPVPSNLSAFSDFDADRDLRGIVVDREDHPVEGASVTARALDLWLRVLAAKRGGSLPDGAVLAEAQTAADGSFRLRLTPGAQTKRPRLGEGLSPTSRCPRSGPAGRSGSSSIRRRRCASVSRARTGNQSRARPCSATSFSRPGDSSKWLRTGTTGADGVVSWEGLPRGRAARSSRSRRTPARAVCP
jgi:hypothetical protein